MVLKMTRIIMHGCNGAMGQVISDIVRKDENVEIVAGIDISDKKDNGYPVFTDIDACDIEADVIIDFCSPKATDKLLHFCKETGLPVVLCTTGLSKKQIEEIEETSKEVAVFKSANMSLGITILSKLLKEAAHVLAEDFDIEIVERHHNQKVDAPSGTALLLADSMNDALNNEYNYVFDRSQVREKRKKKDIGISAIRGGTIVGEHEVIFAGTDEVIEFKHTAYSKAVFAKGAVAAAKFLKGKDAGMYDMSDVVE